MMKEKNKNSVNNFLKIFKLVFKNEKIYFIASIFLCGLVGLLTSMNVLIKQRFFEKIESLLLGNNLRSVIATGIFWGLYMLMTLLIQGASDLMMDDLGIRGGRVLGDLINRKSSKIDPLYYEDVGMLNMIHKAYQGVEQSSAIIRIGITLISYYIPYFCFFAIYTYRIHPALSLILVLVLLPTLVVQRFRSRNYMLLENQVAPLRRKMDYFRDCISDREYARETHLLGTTKYFKKLYNDFSDLFKTLAWKAERKNSLIELALRAVGLVAYVIILLLMFTFTKEGILSVAAFAAILTSIDQLFSFMDYVGNNIGDISSMTPFAINVINFLCLPEKGGEKVKIDNTSIVFDKVSFCYPCSRTFALKQVSFSIKEGETVAIVGENGAGKSTIAKLILGIFVPTTGNVYIGNHSTRDFSGESVYEKSSAVFQNFQRYKMTLKQNVAISDLTMENSQTQISESLRCMDIKVDDYTVYPDGLDSLLSKEFGGTDLSGGQWQRIAIARGMYRRHKIIVLDEPTAAIDPLEESKIYKQFAEISKGKTSIIITHRIGSARIADKIIVMDKGTIVGYGNHEELIKENKLYRTMFNSQAQWYQ